MKKTILSNLTYAMLISSPLLLTACQSMDGLFGNSQDYNYRNTQPMQSYGRTTHNNAATSTVKSHSSSRAAPTNASQAANKATTATPRTTVRKTNSSIVPITPPSASGMTSSAQSSRAATSVTKVPATAPMNAPTAMPSMAAPTVGQ